MVKRGRGRPKGKKKKKEEVKSPGIVLRKLPPELKTEYFPVEFFREGKRFASIVPTWFISTKQDIEDFVEDYKKRPEHVARVYGCRPTISSGDRFCRNPNLVTERANKDRENPVDEDGNYKEWFRPGQHEYVASYDMGIKRDASGFCLAHWDMDKEKVFVDLMLSIEAPEDGEMSFDRLRNIVYDLTTRGFFICCVTTDTWQSEETRQKFVDRGYEFKWVSVDKTNAPYQTLLDLLVEDQIDYYRHLVFEREFSELIYIGKKIDHSLNGSKDLSDAVAAAVHTVREEYSATPLIE